MNTKEKIEQLQNIIDSSRAIVFFTGAGVSTASGIPDFRSQDGLYSQQFRYPPEEIISHHFFYDDTEEFYRFYKQKMIYPDAKPNIVHEYIAKLEKAGRCIGTVTQNIDGLHTAAGSKVVYEIHGSVLRNHCEDCGRSYSLEDVMAQDGVPHCKHCGGLIKPDVVLYEEPLDGFILNRAISLIRSADVLVVLGTSLVVYPAAGLLQYFSGRKLVLINRDATPYDSAADLLIQDTFDHVFPYLHV
ncbi:MAG: NAD-dependent protein deacylase [Solobacterium sp.]|nr:NAD-dependent protein deacylase [Solobacterium sp.]